MKTINHKQNLFAIWLIFTFMGLSGCAFNKERTVEVASLDSVNFVKLEVPEPWSSKMTALQLCIELPKNLIGNATSENKWKAQYKDNSGNLYILSATGIKKNGKKNILSSKVYLNRNLECFTVGFQGEKEYQYIEISSNREVAIEKAYWYWFYYH